MDPSKTSETELYPQLREWHWLSDRLIDKRNEKDCQTKKGEDNLKGNSHPKKVRIYVSIR